jgi:ABC-type nitrate/sulfonate/bicarbonate transport system substrate-binding protein
MRRLLLLVAVIGVLVACAGSEGADGGDAARPVTLMLDWTPNTNHGGIYLAAADGHYAEAGIDVRILQPGQTGALHAVATGNAEFGVSVQESLVPAQLAGLPVLSIAAIVQHNTSSLLSLAAAGIDEPADLPGHRYGGFGGQLERALIERLISCGGGDPAGLDVVEIGTTDPRVGLERGDFDVVWVFDAWDTIRLQHAGLAVSTIPFRDHLDCIPDWYTPLLVTSRELATDDPELVTAFLHATAAGYERAIADPQAAADALLAAAPELDERLVRASADHLAPEFAADAPRWGEQSDQVWRRFVDFLADAGMIESAPVDLTTLYTNQFLPPRP